jgi:hypothetical protein
VVLREDLWAALAIVKRYGDAAMLEAAERADQLLEEGDPWPRQTGIASWTR